MITEKFLRQLYEIKEEMIPGRVYEKAKLHLLDYLGVAYASNGFDNNNEKIFNMAMSLSKEGKSSLIGREESLTAPFAAFYNGVVNHTVELDDTNSEASLHPSSVIISAALACGQEAECSGRKLLYSIIIGYELMIRLGKALGPGRHYARGFHPTATCGVFGGAAAAALLMDLDALQFQMAIGFAGSYTSGNAKYQTEASIAKRLQPAIAAKNGIFAAMEAREGLMGPLTILDDYNGFLNSYTDKAEESYLFENLGSDFQIMKTGLKFYPCCRYNHASVDGLLELMAQYKLTYSEIERVVLEVTTVAMPIVVEPQDVKRKPQNLLDGQFSLFYCAGLTLADGELSNENFTEDKLKSNLVAEQIVKVEIKANPELDKMYPEFWPTIVTIYTTTGEMLRTQIDACKGEPSKFDLAEIEEKYYKLSGRSLTKNEAEELKTRVLNLTQMANIQNLFQL